MGRFSKHSKKNDPSYQPSVEDDPSEPAYQEYVPPDLDSLNIDGEGPSAKADPLVAPLLDIKPNDVVIAVMGITGSGKSTFISHFAKGVVIGHSLEACTSAVGIYEYQYNKDTKIYFVDTPGFDDTYKSDTDILREIADWLSRAYSNQIKLTGIIYLHRILDVRLGGSAMKNLRMFKKLCGDDALASVVLATTWWKGVEKKIGDEREQQLLSTENFWAGMIAKGSKVFRQDDDAVSAKKIVDYLVERKRPVHLKLVEELNVDNKTLDQTGAGIEVDSQLAAQKKMFEEKLRRIEQDLRQAMRDKDEEYEAEMLAFREETKARMEQADRDSAKLQADRDQLRKDMDAQLALERAKLAEQIEKNARETLSLQHEIRIKEMEHANNIVIRELEIRAEKEETERRRLERELAEKSGGCNVM